MAALMRPSVFRQAPATSQRVMSAFVRPSAAMAQLKPAFQNSTRVAAFHATQRNQILPPLPQKIIGTANEPVDVPNPDYTHGSYHWSFERWAVSFCVFNCAVAEVVAKLPSIVSAGLIPLTIAPFAAGSLNPVTDSILCALLVVHSHIGFEACVIDYFPKKRVPMVRNVAMWALRGGTVLLGVALYSFETNDVGVTEAVRQLWTA